MQVNLSVKGDFSEFMQRDYRFFGRGYSYDILITFFVSILANVVFAFSAMAVDWSNWNLSLSNALLGALGVTVLLFINFRLVFAFWNSDDENQEKAQFARWGTMFSFYALMLTTMVSWTVGGAGLGYLALYAVGWCLSFIPNLDYLVWIKANGFQATLAVSFVLYCLCALPLMKRR